MLVQTWPTPFSAPNVANAAPGMATSVSPLCNTNFPLLPTMSQSPMSSTNGDHDATAETPTATKAPGAIGMIQMMNINI